MARFGWLPIPQLLILACLVVGCSEERDERFVGCGVRDDGPNGFTFHSDGTGKLFSVGERVDPEYGSPLRWHTARKEVVIIRLIDEEGNIGGPDSIAYRIESDQLIVGDTAKFFTPKKMTKQK
jgi:hypothetical protein